MDLAAALISFDTNSIFDGQTLCSTSKLQFFKMHHWKWNDFFARMLKDASDCVVFGNRAIMNLLFADLGQFEAKRRHMKVNSY